jgi:Spy/CpxP family protein refolding chaperone
MGPWKWWNDASVQKELGLSAEKIKDIDAFYEKRSKDLKPMADELERQRLELDNMTKAGVTDESVYALQVLRVESLGARLRESRTMMLYRMYRSLQPDQYRKLQDLLDRHYGRSSNNAPGRGRE